MGWLAATLLVLGIAYLACGNLFLRFALRPLVNRSPEKVMMEYASAYTLWPGGAHVHRFQLRNQSRTLEWRLDVEDADVTVNLFALIGKTFHANRIRAEGVSFRLRRKLDDFGAAGPRAGALPPIEGYESPPLRPIGPEEPPVTDAEYSSWITNLEDTTATVREIWVDEWHLLGPAVVTGGFFFKPNRTMQVGPATLDTRSAELRVGETSVLTALDAHLTSTIGAVDLRGPMATNVREISGRGTVEAHVASTDFVRLYLAGVPGLRIEDGRGDLQTALRVEHGRAMPGTWVAVTCDRLVLATRDMETTVAFSSVARVEETSSGPSATGDVRIKRASFVVDGRQGTPPVLEDGRILFQGFPRDLAGPYPMGTTQLDLPVRFPELGWLMSRAGPEVAGAVALTGAGSLRARIDLDPRLLAQGSIQAHADHAAIATPKLGVAGRLAATVDFEQADYRSKTAVLRPSSVVLDGVSVTRSRRAHAGGSARVQLTAGRLERGEPRDFALEIRATHPDLSWLATRNARGGGFGVVPRAAEVTATLDIRRPEALFAGTTASAGVTGTATLAGSADVRFKDLTIRAKVAAAGRVDGAEPGHRSLHLRRLHVEMRRVTVERGSDRTPGWWGNFDFSKVDAELTDNARSEIHVDARCKDASPFLALLVGADVFPSWVAKLFPMTGLDASANVGWANRRGELNLLARGSSARVTALLHDIGGQMHGAVRVQTDIVSIGFSFVRGESHLKVFAGEDWLREQLELDAAPAR